EALDLETLHESMIVLRGGSVTLELGQFCARLSVNVGLLQSSPHILSHMDEDLVRPIEAHLPAAGMRVYTITGILFIHSDGNRKTIHFLHQGRPVQVSAVSLLQALGRRPNIDRLNLEAAQLASQMKAIPVNTEMRTSQPHIFAVGDANGLNDIVHIAIQEG